MFYAEVFNVMNHSRATAAILSATLAAICLPSVSLSQSRDAIAEILGRGVSDFAVRDQEAKIVLEGIGAAYHFPVLVAPDVKGPVTFEVHDATVRTLIDAVCQPGGWSYEISDQGFLLVRRFVTRIYPVDYLQMSRTGAGSAAVNRAGVSGAAMGEGTGPLYTPLPAQRNDTDFWGGLESDLRAMLADGESLVVNRFAGVVQLRGSLQTHAVIGAYLHRVVQRIGRQARISVKVVEVDLKDRSQPGIDWTAVRPSTEGSCGVAGGVEAAIRALSEQGTVRVESKPEVSALNNQTAFIQVGEDKPFFLRTEAAAPVPGETSRAPAQPLAAYDRMERTTSFGTFLEVTVQISDDLTTKLTLSPAMTELEGTAISPDGLETAPVMGTQRACTTVIVRNHETAFLGGFLAKTIASGRRGIPFLSAVPILGGAFATPARAATRTELVFLVTVNAEEAAETIPAETKAALPDAANVPASSGPGPADSTRRVERMGISGDAT